MISFYNVKKRQSVEIDESKCKKVMYTSNTSKGVRNRYAVKAVDSDGMKLTKFINKATYDALKCPQE